MRAGPTVGLSWIPALSQYIQHQILKRFVHRATRNSLQNLTREVDDAASDFPFLFLSLIVVFDKPIWILNRSAYDKSGTKISLLSCYLRFFFVLFHLFPIYFL